MSNKPAQLTTSETRIVNKLSRNGDVAISVLFRLLRGRWPLPEESGRRQQQFVGATTSRANRKLKLKGYRITPGVKRGTYRMTRI